MKTPDINKFCFKIFHLPELSATNSIRKENFRELNIYLSNHLKNLETPTIHIGNKKQYFDFNETYHLLKPTSKFKWGELGIWASNLLAFQNFVKSDFEYTLLIEDDILIENKERFLRLLIQYLKQLPDDWDMFSFYCPENQFKKYKPEIQNERKSIVPAYQDYSMVCNVVNRKCAIKVLDDIKQNGIDLPIDHYFFRNKNMFKVYTLTPDAEKGCSLIETDSTFQNIQSHVKVPLTRNEKNFKTWNENFTETQINQFKTNAITEIKQAPENFWNAITEILENKESSKAKKSLGKVLVYKSYGGLGDIFFAIPAINKLAAVSEHVDFAVAPRLVSFFKKHLDQVNVVDEKAARTSEHNYDNVYELGNYPAFRGYDLPHALKYPTHKKVKQHAIGHYIDTVAKLHKDIENHLERYPYFKRNPHPEENYFVVHHGAGFLLKIWPTEKYATLIERLREIFPNLKCKIIKGPDDPDIESYFSREMTHVEYITGGMEDVGEAMAGALFHIGNDAGITHVAGAFNVPSVGIYGPTGPGSWGSFAEHNELIWGKQGVCSISCNYDVILNCEHRICLTSVTVERVLEALYKVLHKSYNSEFSILKTNPMLDVEFGKKDCLLKIGGNEFLIEYQDAVMKDQLEILFKSPMETDKNNPDLQLAISLFKQQNILFDIPTFY
tara:strand:- start:16782 stop:18788 length:2007 start_codon:yes stop_codon:yes gene_type:complete